MTTSETGVTHVLAAPGLDASALTDPAHVRAMVAGWSRDDLYALGSLLTAEGDRHTERELLQLLRWLCEPREHESPTVNVEFVTYAYDDGVVWDDDTLYLHRADGTIEPYDWPEDHHTDPTWEAKAGRYAELLQDYSSAHPPADGEHLIVDLATGAFDVSGKWV